MSRVGKQFEILLNYSNVEDTDFYNPFKYQLLDDSKEAIEIQEEAKKVIENDVMPAFVKLRGTIFFNCHLVMSILYSSNNFLLILFIYRFSRPEVLKTFEEITWTF